jgi:hypothetical protein
LFIFSFQNKQNTMEARKQIPTLTFGKLPSTYKSTIQISKHGLLFDFASTLQQGPQIISLAVPPYRHAFLVDIQTCKILISDWNGPKKDSNANWEEYYTFLQLLHAIYNKPVEFYNVDKELFDEAMYKQSMFSGGGCAHYIYEWTKKYYQLYTV